MTKKTQTLLFEFKTLMRLQNIKCPAADSIEQGIIKLLDTMANQAAVIKKAANFKDMHEDPSVPNGYTRVGRNQLFTAINALDEEFIKGREVVYSPLTNISHTGVVQKITKAGLVRVNFGTNKNPTYMSIPKRQLTLKVKT